jgi:hypothetical protein
MKTIDFKKNREEYENIIKKMIKNIQEKPKKEKK